MSESCFHSNPLTRDGTNQQQRTLATLLPSYVAVDERSMKDLSEFVQAFGEEIKFFDKTNAEDGHWADFFKITDAEWETFSLEAYLQELKISQQTNPHLALFFGFLYMFKVVQEDLNTITERHLNFYYKEVLQLQEKPTVPDKVAVLFELAKHVEHHLLRKGTALKAGKDHTGKEVVYSLNSDTVINKTQVAELKALFANLYDELPPGTGLPKTGHKLYPSPVANSADGLGADIETEEKNWRIFGRPQLMTDPENPAGPKIVDRPEGTVGFAIASPILFLSEGQRKVVLDINIDFKGHPKTTVDLTDELSLLLSGEEGWMEAQLEKDSAVIAFTDGAWKLSITANLTADQPPVVAYDDAVFQEHIATRWPVLKVLLKTDDPAKDSVYKRLLGRGAQHIDLTVEVDGEAAGIPGIQNLIVQNDQGLLDPTKPMQIFGSQPHIGSKFLIGSWEIFQKRLEHIHLKFNWVDLPQDSEGFSAYYLHYHVEGTSNARDNSTFNTKIEVLRKKEWETVKSSTPLFTDDSGNAIADSDTLPSSDDRSKLSISDIALKNIGRLPDLETFEEFDPKLSKGFIRFSLKGGDFGHKEFPNAYAYHAINLANAGGTGWTLPNPPYLPVIEGLSLYYKSKVSFNLNRTTSIPEDNNLVEQFFHLEPFGNYEVDKNNPSNTLLPKITDEGSLFIGLGHLKPPQTLALLIQVAEGSANPKKERQTVTWSYLTEAGWIPFDQYSLLSDSTDGLLTSGIVKLDIPRTISLGNPRMPPDRYWLKASVTKDSDAVCDLIDIRAQAIMASFEDQDNDPKFLENALEPGTISKLVKADAAVKKIEQPYASFDGRPPEKEKAFFTRVSERLRHKQRAITIWDYEHLILEAFPKVYKAKCVNHTRFDGTLSDYSETAPGNVSIVIVANVQNKNAVDPLRPLASLAQLSEIKSFIEAIKPPCAILHVKNPIYEEVKVDFKVKFHQGIDAGYYLAKLQTEIKNFLSPWASDCYSDIAFGGRIHRSVVLNFVEERSYVDYVTCFKMFHIVHEDPDNNPKADVAEAIALTSVSIIGSADEHTIHEIAASAADQCQCEDNVIKDTAALIASDPC